MKFLLNRHPTDRMVKYREPISFARAQQFLQRNRVLMPTEVDPRYWLGVCRGQQAAIAWLVPEGDLAEVVSGFPILALPEFQATLDCLNSGPSGDDQVVNSYAISRLRVTMAHLESDSPDAFASLLVSCANELLQERRGDPYINTARAVELYGAARAIFEPTELDSAECLLRESSARLRLIELGGEADDDLKLVSNFIEQVRLTPNLSSVHLSYCTGLEAKFHLFKARLGVDVRENLEAAIHLYGSARSDLDPGRPEFSHYVEQEQMAQTELENLSPDFLELYSEDEPQRIISISDPYD